MAQLMKTGVCAQNPSVSATASRVENRRSNCSLPVDIWDRVCQVFCVNDLAFVLGFVVGFGDGVQGKGAFLECTPKMRQEIKGPITLNGGEQCLCPDKNIPAN